MPLFAVNRLAGNSAIGNAVTLPRAKNVTRFDSLVHVSAQRPMAERQNDASYSRLVLELDRGGSPGPASSALPASSTTRSSWNARTHRISVSCRSRASDPSHTNEGAMVDEVSVGAGRLCRHQAPSGSTDMTRWDLRACRRFEPRRVMALPCF
jgi:hypothetical protein